jgi:thiamine transport system permease protein
VAFLAVFFGLPMLAILGRSLTNADGALDLSGFTQIISNPYYWETLVFTTGQALLSTLLTLLAALPCAYVFVRYRFPGKQVLMALATLPFVLPTVVVAAAFDALLGERGLLNQVAVSAFGFAQPPIQLERSLLLILIAHVFYNFAVALRMIVGYWVGQSPRLEEAARVLGVTGWGLWWRVRLPMLRPAIISAAALVFIFTFTSFGVVLLLGGSRFATLEVEIYRQTVNLFNLPVAAALSLVQIVVMSAMMLVYSRLQRQRGISRSGAGFVLRRPVRIGERFAVFGAVVAMVILLIAPLAAMILRLFVTGDGLQSFARLTQNPRGSILFVPPLTAVQNSLVIAVLATVFAVVLGVLSAQLINGRRGAVWDVAFMLPLATSAVTLGFGFLIALNGWGLGWLLIPIAHTLVALPFVIRSVLPALRAVPQNLREAGASLGYGPFGVWRRVTLPLISRGIAVGATFAFTVSMGEFGASLFIARPDTPTMPVVIFRLFGQPGISNYSQALAMSTLLMLVCAVAFLLIERLRTAGIGEF